MRCGGPPGVQSSRMMAHPAASLAANPPARYARRSGQPPGPPAFPGVGSGMHSFSAAEHFYCLAQELHKRLENLTHDFLAIHNPCTGHPSVIPCSRLLSTALSTPLCTTMASITLETQRQQPGTTWPGPRPERPAGVRTARRERAAAAVRAARGSVYRPAGARRGGSAHGPAGVRSARRERGRGEARGSRRPCFAAPRQSAWPGERAAGGRGRAGKRPGRSSGPAGKRKGPPHV